MKLFEETLEKMPIEFTSHMFATELKKQWDYTPNMIRNGGQASFLIENCIKANKDTKCCKSWIKIVNEPIEELEEPEQWLDNATYEEPKEQIVVVPENLLKSNWIFARNPDLETGSFATILSDLGKENKPRYVVKTLYNEIFLTNEITNLSKISKEAFYNVIQISETELDIILQWLKDQNQTS